MSRLNPYHGNFAWLSLVWVALADLYVRLVASGVIHDPRVFWRETATMADQATRQLRVWRGDAAGGGLADYTVAVHEGEVVLDVLHRLQATQASDLAIRWNCKAGKCGSCSAEINGRPKLLCMTRLSPLPPGPVTITPLRTYPVIRDLVTDVSVNYGWALHVPSFAPPEALKPGEYRMAQADVDRSQEFRKCIECWLCQDVCHVIRDHEDNMRAVCRTAVLHPARRAGHAPARRARSARRAARAAGPGPVQHHQVLH